VSGPAQVISAANASQLVLQNTGAGTVTVRVAPVGSTQPSVAGPQSRPS
jgi:hypothetical protein